MIINFQKNIVQTDSRNYTYDDLEDIFTDMETEEYVNVSSRFVKWQKERIVSGLSIFSNFRDFFFENLVILTFQIPMWIFIFFMVPDWILPVLSITPIVDFQIIPLSRVSYSKGDSIIFTLHVRPLAGGHGLS